jgi:hypothetical protein
LDIAVRNISTVATDAEIKEWIAAQQIQFDRDFTPVWGIVVKLRFVTKTEKLHPKEALIVVSDTSDDASAAGYHYTSSIGTPLGKVFWKTTLEAGMSPTVCGSHEAMELAGDPYINDTVFDESTGRLWAKELCDACEADECGYRINGVLLSDFCMPEYFEPDVKLAKNHYRTFNGKVTGITRPFALAPGGYLSYLDINNPQAGWQQISARTVERPGSRRARRENQGERPASTAE